jgi:hypothetical protein
MPTEDLTVHKMVEIPEVGTGQLNRRRRPPEVGRCGGARSATSWLGAQCSWSHTKRRQPNVAQMAPDLGFRRRKAHLIGSEAAIVRHFVSCSLSRLSHACMLICSASSARHVACPEVPAPGALLHHSTAGLGRRLRRSA